MTGTQILQNAQNTAQSTISLDIGPQTKCTQEPQTRYGEQLKPKMISRDIPPYPDPIYRPPPRPPDIPLQGTPRKLIDLDSDINIDFEENCSYQEGIISGTYQRSDRSYFQEPPELDSLINTGRLVQTFLPKQVDIDKILKIIKRKVLKGTHLPVTAKEIQAGYLSRPHFKDLYLYLVQSKLPSTKTVICKIETLVEKYILLDSLLFKLVTTPEKESVLLAIPEKGADKIITL